MLKVALGLANVVASVMEIALCDDAKSADRGKHPAFGAVDLVHAIPVSHWPTLTATWQVEAFREYISGIMLVITVALASATPAADAAVPRIATITLLVANIVTVPHSIVSTSQQTVGAAPPPSVLLARVWTVTRVGRNQPLALIGWRRMASDVFSRYEFDSLDPAVWLRARASAVERGKR